MSFQNFKEHDIYPILQAVKEGMSVPQISKRFLLQHNFVADLLAFWKLLKDPSMTYKNHNRIKNEKRLKDLTKTEAENIIADYSDLSTLEISRKYDFNVNSLYNLIHFSRLYLDANLIPKKSKTNPKTLEMVEKIKDLKLQGLQKVDIAKRLGVSRQYIHVLMQRYED